MAPLAQSFIGSYMIDPFFQSYASAVHAAASTQKPLPNPEANQDEDSPYTLVTTRHVGMTGIMLFALDPNALQDLRSTEVSFGAGDMANKGAVGLRMLFSKQDAAGQNKQTELTFVGTHLAPHEWNLEKRNKNWETIVSGLRKFPSRTLILRSSTHFGPYSLRRPPEALWHQVRPSHSQCIH